MAGQSFCVHLLLASVIQAFPDIQVQHVETQEAVEGQNITLPCAIIGPAHLHLTNVEWGRKEVGGLTKKLALYSPGRGEHLFLPNVSIQIQTNGTEQPIGAALLLPDLRRRDSGVYICDITVFPSGAIRRETLLTVTGQVITSSQHPTQSTVSSSVMSSTGEFVTSSMGGFVTSSTGGSVTSLTSSSMTSSTSSSMTSSTGSSTTSSTGSSTISSTSGSVTSSTRKPDVTSGDRTSPSRTSRVTGDQSTQRTGNWSQTLTLSPEDATSSQSNTSGQSNETSGDRQENPTLRSMNNTGVYGDKINEDKGSWNVLLWWIVAPVLLSIVLLGLFWRRRSLKNRMDLPPPFKPPPPPVRYEEVSLQPS